MGCVGCGVGSVGVELRGGCKCLSDLNLDAETEVYIRRTIRDHISFKIMEMGAKGNARLIEEERKRNERRATPVVPPQANDDPDAFRKAQPDD